MIVIIKNIILKKFEIIIILLKQQKLFIKVLLFSLKKSYFIKKNIKKYILII